jgi:hypothetical protein
MYEVGQKVVCVKTHPKGVVKEGEIYTVKDIQIDCCRELVLDVGIRDDGRNYFKESRPTKIGASFICSQCGKTVIFDGIWWLAANRFRPLDDMYNEEIEELTEVLSEPVTFSL